MENLLILSVERADTRIEAYNGVDHLVVPVVALVETVLQSANAESPNMVLAEEFSKVPGGWNGRPVVVNHPQKNGMYVSANSPDVLEGEKIGEIFNTMVEDNKLKMEAWINLARAEELGGTIWETVQALQAGEKVVEISTGLFADIESKSGEYNGKEFKGIWRNIVPDHLAILSEDSVGACSVEDGCGAPRVNKCSSSCQCDKCTEMDQPTSIFGKIKSLMKFVDNRKKLSDVDRRNRLSAALRNKVNDFWYLELVYNKTVVYYAGERFYEQTYTIESDGSVSLGDERKEVIPETRFVEVTSNRSSHMDKEKFVSELISNKRTRFKDEDRAWLMDQEEAVLEKFAPQEEAEKTEAEDKSKDAPVNNTATQQAAPTRLTTEEFLNSAPDDVRSVLSEGLKLQRSHRAELITSIKKNPRNKLSDEVLSHMETEVLESIAAVSQVDDFSSRGTGHTQTPTANNAVSNPMPLVFEKKKSAA